jgi:hypothetical protein
VVRSTFGAAFGMASAGTMAASPNAVLKAATMIAGVFISLPFD